MNGLKHIRSHGRAFTLLEFVVVITVLGIIAGLGSAILVESGRAYSRSNITSAAQTDAQYALNRLAVELTELQSPSDISALSSTSITFEVDGVERTFQLSGGSLRRDSNLLATDVSSFTLTCYRSDGTVTSTPTDVHRIAADISISRGGQTVSLRTEVFPRAFRSTYTAWDYEGLD